MSKLLINEPPLQVLPSLAVAVGLNEAIVLQQLHYWLEKSTHIHDGRRWVYNTTAEWQENFPFWSEPTIRRVFASLKKKGVVLTGNYNRAGFDRTLWYSIDYEKLEEMARPFDEIVTPCDQLDQMEARNLITPIPETTQETTSIRPIASPAEKKPIHRAPSQSNNTSGDRDGRMLLELVRAKGFLYLDSQPSRMAMLLESDYSDAQLRTALERTAEAHQKQIKTGRRGITAPLAYIRQVLAGMDSDQLAATDTNIVNINSLLENAHV